MSISIIDTVGNQIQVLDDGTTVMDVMLALGWVKRERERKRKYKKVYKPTGNPRGRPKKSPAPNELESDGK